MLDQQSLGVLRNRISSGEIVLFTGAGFSCEAKAADGQALPGSQELRRMLWPIAFPGQDEDEESSLADVYECALSQAPRRLRDVLEACLRVDHGSLPAFYSTWFSVPWARAYTLNIDDLAVAAERAFGLPRRVRAVSGSEPVPTPSDELTVVHLNGQLDDLPNATFSAPQYGRRLPGRDPWYSTQAADPGRGFCRHDPGRTAAVAAPGASWPEVTRTRTEAAFFSRDAVPHCCTQADAEQLQHRAHRHGCETVR